MAEMTIRRFSVLSVAKIYALLLFIIGLIIGVLYGLMFMFLGATMSFIPRNEGSAAVGGVASIVIGILIMIAVPIMYSILGFISGSIAALIYNAAAGVIGGVRFELEPVDGYMPPPQNWVPNQ